MFQEILYPRKCGIMKYGDGVKRGLILNSTVISMCSLVTFTITSVFCDTLLRPLSKSTTPTINFQKNNKCVDFACNISEEN